MSQSKRTFSLVVVVALLAIGLLSGVATVLRSETVEQTSLQDLNSLEELQAFFNNDHGKPRLLLLLSPT